MHVADFGADVLLTERPGTCALDELPAAPMWRRGKRTLPQDLSSTEDLERLHSLGLAPTF